MSKVFSESIDIGGRTLKFETGKLAQQATSSVLASYGETMVLATIVASGPRDDLDYFPLIVEYVERLYAGGRIKGSRWVKREGRPSDDAILTARLIDRSIRPLFPKSYKSEIQVVVTVLSVDGENDPDILGILAVSAALAISPIPWKGPIGSVRLGFIAGESESHFLVNPEAKELENSKMNLVVSTTKDKVHMIEAEANEIEEDVMIQAIEAAKKESQVIIEAIEKLVKKAGRKKLDIPANIVNEKLRQSLTKKYKKEIDVLTTARGEGEETDGLLDSLTTQLETEFGDEFGKKEILSTIDELVREKVRDNIIKNDKRPDGRGLDEIRSLQMEVGVLPRTHGSAIFARGTTQALTVATLGSPSMEQLIESATGEESKRYIHHYNMPPYSVGETGRFGFPKRREVGHGALAERALVPVIPEEKVFPYTIRLVSEIMSSNGSTSMASVCGSTLALMDAGVPIKSPVAGISIGLVLSKKTHKLLTDIIGLEDFFGDMDFKVAGTKKGITAIQLDVKIDGLDERLVEGAINQAKKARMTILGRMAKILPEARKVLSEHAPKVRMLTIPAEKIGEVIGPGGRVIRKIIADTGAAVDVNDEGKITITGIDKEGVEKAVAFVEGLTRELQAGEKFEGVVKRIVPFGAFVEVLPGKEGLVHVSQMSTEYVSNPEEVVKLGQSVNVRVREVDDQGRLNLTMLSQEEAKMSRRPRNVNGFDRRNDRRNNRGRRNNRNNGRRSYR